jgi:hypothetical protein
LDLVCCFSVLQKSFLLNPLMAQIDRGTIEGRITDQSGAVVPDATIQVIQVQTKSTLTFITNEEGLYTAPNLPMGTYRLVIQKTGFSTLVREPVEVRPAVKVRVDFSLSLGAITETVNVSAEAPLLDVSATSNSTGLTSTTIEGLPMIVSAYQRSITDLLPNLPGFTSGDSFVPRANGGAGGDTEVFIDGGPASEWGIARGGLSEVSPLIEQVGEFSVVANGFNAEYGGFGNWFTNVTIKSGTNELHGSVFDHLGNDVLNARDWFQPEVTPFRQNEAGFTLGGPVVIPKIYNGRNKTFFFGSLGLFYSRVGAGGSVTTVPTPKMISGDFSELGDIKIYDPATTRIGADGSIIRDPFLNNIIPADRISAAARMIAPYIPPPDMPGINNNYISRAAPSWPYLNSYSPLIKVDHSISDKQKLSAMYSKGIKHRVIWEGGRIPQPVWGETQTNPIDHVTDQIADNWKVRVNHDYILTNALVNHITFSMASYINRGANNTVDQGWDQNLGIQGIPADDGSFPAIIFSGGAGAPEGFGRSYDEDWREKRYSFHENLTWVRGKHTMKFGFSLEMNDEDRHYGGEAGSFTFSNSSSHHCRSECGMHTVLPFGSREPGKRLYFS